MTAKPADNINQDFANQCRIYFGLFGTFEPQQLTDRIGVRPTTATMQGSKDKERGIPVTSIWEFSTERIVSSAIDVYEMADEIVQQLWPHTEKIRDAIVELDLKATLQAVIHFSTHDEVSTPAIGFSNQVLAFLTEVNANIDIDTYILPNSAE